jgi:hypothetical protein
MLLSDRLWFFDKPIIALSGGHFEDFLTFSENNYTGLRTSGTPFVRSPPVKGGDLRSPKLLLEKRA